MSTRTKKGQKRRAQSDLYSADRGKKCRLDAQAVDVRIEQAQLEGKLMLDIRDPRDMSKSDAEGLRFAYKKGLDLASKLAQVSIQKVEKMQSKLDRTTTQLTALKKDKLALKTSLAQEKKATSEAENALDTALSEYEANLQVVKDQLLVSEREKSGAKSALKDAQQERAAATGKLESQVQDLQAQLKDAQSDAQQQVRNLQAQLKDAQSDAQQQVQDLQAQLKDAQSDAQQQVQDLQAQLKDAQSDAQQQVQNLRTQLKDAQLDAQRLKNDVKRAATQHDAAVQELRARVTLEEQAAQASVASAREAKCSLDAARAENKSLTCTIQELELKLENQELKREHRDPNCQMGSPPNVLEMGSSILNANQADKIADLQKELDEARGKLQDRKYAHVMFQEFFKTVQQTIAKGLKKQYRCVSKFSRMFKDLKSNHGDTHCTMVGKVIEEFSKIEYSDSSLSHGSSYRGNDLLKQFRAFEQNVEDKLLKPSQEVRDRILEVCTDYIQTLCPTSEEKSNAEERGSGNGPPTNDSPIKGDHDPMLRTDDLNASENASEDVTVGTIENILSGLV